MKKVLITGVNSYIGTNVENWLLKNKNIYKVSSIDMRDDKWKHNRFSDFDVVLHVAGIAHVSSKGKMKDLYYRVNCDLAIEAAKKSKNDGIKQFIFISSIIIYGNNFGKSGYINKNTPPAPEDFYGKSKLKAENGIIALEDNTFKVSILRLPMIYGKEARGNYIKLAKLAKLTPIFPKINNKRSMLHIDNLCEFIKIIIDKEKSGMYFPQNKEYVNVSEMVELIAKQHGKKLILFGLFNPFLIRFMKRSIYLNKIFGNLVYEKELSSYKSINYQIRNFIESINLSEK